MPIYQLEPRDLNSPHWGRSWHRALCLVATHLFAGRAAFLNGRGSGDGPHGGAPNRQWQENVRRAEQRWGPYNRKTAS